MRVTPKMLEAARRAEYDWYRERGWGNSPFIGTLDAVIRTMIQAALDAEFPDMPPRAIAAVPPAPKRAIVTAAKPRKRR